MTHVDPSNAAELAAIAHEVGAEILTGHLRYPSESGGWQLGAVDLTEYLARHRDRRLVLIIAPVSEVEPETFTCGICGSVMDAVQECPRCRLEVEVLAAELQAKPNGEAVRPDGRELAASDGRDVLDQVRDLLDGAAEDGATLD